MADVNARDELTHFVASVGVFGSYTKKSAKDLADIDICLDLRERKIAGRDPVKYASERAANSGRRFGNIVERWAYGETEVCRLLKARSPYISLHDHRDLKRIGARAKEIYRHN